MLQVTPESFQSIPLFNGFTPSERQQVAEIAKVTKFQPGEVVVEQGARSQELWVLLDGTCEVTRQVHASNGDQAPIVLATLEPYSAFGEMSFFHAAPHSASVKAKSRVQLICVDRARFDELIRHEPTVAYKLALNVIHSLAERMRRMDEWVEELIAEQNQGPEVPELARLREKLFDSWQL